MAVAAAGLSPAISRIIWLVDIIAKLLASIKGSPETGRRLLWIDPEIMD